MIARRESLTPTPDYRGDRARLDRDTIPDVTPPASAPESRRERSLELVKEERFAVGTVSLAKEGKGQDRVYQEGTNQDRQLVSRRARFFGVFDGMGSHKGAEEIALLAANTVEETGVHATSRPSFLKFRQELPKAQALEEELGVLREYIEGWGMEPSDFMSEAEVEKMLSQGIIKAQETIKAYREKVGRKEGATTASVFTFFETAQGGLIAKITNVGDSRVYRLRGGKLEQGTTDDSLYNWLVEQGLLAGKESPNDPLPREVAALVPNAEVVGDLRNMLAKGVGQEEELTFEVQSLDAEEGDLFIALTDGIWSNLTPEQLESCLRMLQKSPPDNIAATLAEYARQEARTGRVGTHPDDMTTVVVHVNRFTPLVQRLARVEERFKEKFSAMDYDQLYRETIQIYPIRSQIEVALEQGGSNPKLELLHEHIMRVLQMIDLRQRELRRSKAMK